MFPFADNLSKQLHVIFPKRKILVKPQNSNYTNTRQKPLRSMAEAAGGGDHRALSQHGEEILPRTWPLCKPVKTPHCLDSSSEQFTS